MHDTSTSWLQGGASRLETPQDRLDLIHILAMREARTDREDLRTPDPGFDLAAALGSARTRLLAAVGRRTAPATLDCCTA